MKKKVKAKPKSKKKRPLGKGRLIARIVSITLVLAVVVWLLSNVVKQTKGWHPLAFIAISALAGIVFSF